MIELGLMCQWSHHQHDGLNNRQSTCMCQSTAQSLTVLQKEERDKLVWENTRLQQQADGLKSRFDTGLMAPDLIALAKRMHQTSEVTPCHHPRAFVAQQHLPSISTKCLLDTGGFPTGSINLMPCTAASISLLGLLMRPVCLPVC